MAEASIARLLAGFSPTTRDDGVPPTAPSAQASDAPLRRLGEKQSLAEYLRGVWVRREFIWNIAAGNLRAQHMDTTLGNLWHVVNPLLLLMVYYFVFGVIIDRTSEDIPNFIGFLAVGIFVFNYCQRAMTSGASSIVGNVGLIRSLQFPRAVLPISSVVEQLITFGSSVVVMLLLLLLTGERPSFGWLMLVPITVLATLFGAGGAFITSRLTDQVRDIQNVLPYLFRLVFYMSGILFSVDKILDRERFAGMADTLRTLFLFNPFYDIVGIARHYLMSTYDEPQVEVMWLAFLVYTVVTLGVGIVFFRGGEGGYGRG